MCFTLDVLDVCFFNLKNEVYRVNKTQQDLPENAILMDEFEVNCRYKNQIMGCVFPSQRQAERYFDELTDLLINEGNYGNYVTVYQSYKVKELPNSDLIHEREKWLRGRRRISTFSINFEQENHLTL